MGPCYTRSQLASALSLPEVTHPRALGFTVSGPTRPRTRVFLGGGSAPPYRLFPGPTRPRTLGYFSLAGKVPKRALGRPQTPIFPGPPRPGPQGSLFSGLPGPKPRVHFLSFERPAGGDEDRGLRAVRTKVNRKSASPLWAGPRLFPNRTLARECCAATECLFLPLASSSSVW